MAEKEDDRKAPRPDAKQRDVIAVIEADDLFRGSREVFIEHGGVRYRLRITRRNKLILHK